MPTKKARKPDDHLTRLLDRLEEVEPEGESWLALCPAHDDTRPSLLVSQAEDGRLLLHCRSRNCEVEDILDRLGLKLSDLYPRAARRIVATYNYRDKRGKLLYQKVRYEPKAFHLRRKKGRKWVYGSKGLSRIPYMLPELLKADPTKPVFITEGEKDADNLADLGLIATTNRDGAGKYDRHFLRYLIDRRVVILPDNDAAGLDHAQNLADTLAPFAEWVKVVQLPDLSEKGDVSDWLDAGGTKKRLLQLVKAAEPWKPGKSELSGCRVVGLSNTPDVLPFPAEVFPDSIAEFIQREAEDLPCPPDLVAVPMLAALGVAIGNTIRLQAKPGFIEAPRIYSAMIARPGDRKSPALDRVTAPLHAIQRELETEYRQAFEEYEASLKEEPQDRPDKPIMRQLITTDSTIESMVQLLNQNPRGLLFKQDELTAWTRSMGQYKRTGGNDRQYWLSFWSGADQVINRKGQSTLTIHNPFVCVTGGIQPDMLGELVDRQGRQDGFLHRVLIAYPDPVPVKWAETPANDKPYREVILKLWGKGNPTPKQTLQFTTTAKREWIKWIDSHHKELDSLSNNLRGVWSKFDGYSLRLLIIIHRCRYVTGETRSRNIDRESVRRMVKLIDYFKSHARRVYDRIAKNGDQTRLGRAAQWIRERGGTATPRDVVRHGLINCKNTSEAKKLLQDLAEAGYGKISQGKQRRSVIFTLSDE